MLKTAVIGVGSIGRNHARIYADLADSDLCFVCDADAVSGQDIANKYNTVWGDDLDQLLDTYQPDLVSVCVPTILSL